MKTSTLTLLQDPTVIVLAGGHGANDTGACNGDFKERDQAIVIVDLMAAELRNRGLITEIAPHEHDTEDSISWINNRFSFGDAWVLEVHRDSADGLGDDDASRRCGIYSGPSESSVAVAKYVKGSYLRHGAHEKSWARPDTECRFGRLGWIRQTRPAAHLLELAFMEGQNTDTHLKWLANIGAAVVYEAFTGTPY